MAAARARGAPGRLTAMNDESARGAAQGAAERLLDVIAALVRESHPGNDEALVPALDSALDRDLGIDSLARVELLLRIERAFDVRMPEALVAAAQTPRDLLRALLAGSPRETEALEALPSRAARAEGIVEPAHAATLRDVLEWHAARDPGRTHVILLDEADHEDVVTYGALLDESRRVAEGLARRGVGAGQAVAIMLPTSRAFFRACRGCVLAGAIPVPIYPPASAARIAEHLRRQSLILANCEAVLLVTTPEGERVARTLRALVPSLGAATTADALAREAAHAPLPALRASDVAMLQYTSGSTGDPKGVVLTHANVLANIRAMGRAVRASADDVFVSWLPLYHDMGLIGAWMGALYYGFTSVILPPAAFINRPSRWPRTIHRYRGTLSSAPNFAYEICATRVDERDLAGLDLSCWRMAFNGAEPVNPGTLERFASRFARYGLKREAIAPVYGLAECAVGLAFPAPGRGPRIDRVDRATLASSGRADPAREDDASALAFAGCGAPLAGYEIRVVDASHRELPERFEGRIEFRGPSATSGYYRNPARTADLFDGDWLDTGDLGYVAGGEIFVTSRAKDVIIRGGQHIHPYELENAVGEIAGVRRGCVAVFGVAEPATGTERAIVLAETRLRDAAAREKLRGAIAETALAVLGAPADDIVLAPPHTVLKTSSGKIRRAASRDAYLAGGAHAAPRVAWSALATFGFALAAGRLRRGWDAAREHAYGAYAWSAAALVGACALGVALLPARLRWRALHRLARMLLGISRLPVAVDGLERLPATQPFVAVTNHASYVDGPLLFALLQRPVRFVAKRELAGNPVVRLLLAAAGVVFVERFDVERSTEDARRLAALAAAGEPLVFFAEGTFTRAPGLRPFFMGAFVAAAQAALPVVPIALRGTRSVLRDGRWMPRCAPVHVTVDPPVHATGSEWADAVRLREAVRARILLSCGEPDLSR